MPRHPRHVPLCVLLNNRLVGHLSKAASGAISFQYDAQWLAWEHALPVSLSLQLRETPYRGDEVSAVFENLLPDSTLLRQRVAEKVGAAGTDAYSMLAAIGRDCVGALQFVADDDRHDDDHHQFGEPVGETSIETILKGLAQAPLGLDRDDEFRISVAGAQEKTALLFKDGQWFKPHGTTPTTHILKPPIGRLPNGIDLSHSVENEFYCLKLAAAFGLPVNQADIMTFGETSTLVIERFDRRWTRDGRLLRVPQEDFCQALSVPPTRKYQSDGGPSLVQILELLKGSNNPGKDQAIVLKAQILFWLIGATDGHAKNFSVFLGPGGTYELTPLYDILTAQPSLEAGQIQRKQMKLAMSAGKNRHYKMEEIVCRHFIQTGEAANMPKAIIAETIEQMADTARQALDRTEADLPADFPEAIPTAVRSAVLKRSGMLQSSMS